VHPITAVQNAKTLIVLPTYQELENLPTLIEAIRTELPEANFFIVDDNSPDGTREWCDLQAQEHANFAFTIRTHERGLGSATLVGLRYAIDKQFDFVATMDADWSHDPKFLPDMIAKLMSQPDFDVCIGSRYIAGGGIEGWPWRRRVVSRLVNVLTRLLLGLTTRDNSGAFRVYRVSALNKLALQAVRCIGYGYLEEILFRLKNVGARAVEVPIVFRDRVAGSSKTALSEGLNVLASLGRLGLERLRMGR
jgi:dolichol-phosphate mannosyltransferase